MNQKASGHIAKRFSGTFKSWFLGILLLSGLIVSITHFGELEKFIRLAGEAEPSWLIVAAILQIATYFCAAGVWKLALHRGGIEYSFMALVPLGIAKLFSDQAMPSGGMSGTAFFVAALRHRGIAADLCMATLLVSVICYYCAYLIVASVSITLLWFYHAINPWIISVYFFFCLLAVVIPAGILLAKRLTKKEIPVWFEKVPGVQNILKSFKDAPVTLLRSPTLIISAVCLHGAVFILDALTLWIMLMAVGQHVSFLVVFPSFVLASIVTTIGPIPLGLGTFEATCVATLGLLGTQLEAALTATLLLRGLTLWLPMLPGLWLARRELH